MWLKFLPKPWHLQNILLGPCKTRFVRHPPSADINQAIIFDNWGEKFIISRADEFTRQIGLCHHQNQNRRSKIGLCHNKGAARHLTIQDNPIVNNKFFWKCYLFNKYFVSFNNYHNFHICLQYVFMVFAFMTYVWLCLVYIILIWFNPIRLTQIFTFFYVPNSVLNLFKTCIVHSFTCLTNNIYVWMLWFCSSKKK